MPKYYVSKGNDQEKRNQWFDYCRKEQIPYIIIRKRTKYSYIHWDYITYKPNLDKIFEENNYIPDRAKIIFDEYANKKSSCSITKFSITFYEILNEDALELAEKLFDLIDRFVKQNERI